MKRIFLLLLSAATVVSSFAQNADVKDNFTVIKNNPATPVKSQARTGTCWSFSTTSLVESQALKNNLGEFDLSEMFTVRNIYIEKAKNYILRQGHTQFDEGGLGHDQIRAIATYGAVPESVYSGLKPGQTAHNHQALVSALKGYLDSLLKHRPIPGNWLAGFTDILDNTLGAPPKNFEFRGKNYTPQTFAKDVLHFKADDYVAITSFTHHPFYEPFILEVPDNFSNGAYYNIPLEEMIQVTKDALTNGYTVLWDADVSNNDFMQGRGLAALYDSSVNSMRKMNMRTLRASQQKREAAAGNNTDNVVAARNETPGNSKNAASKDDYVAGLNEEVEWDAEFRQTLFENLTTQDDHLMHITGIEKTKNGKSFFIVKNSWGNVGPYKGYINVSESYFAINTISLIVPKAALSKALLEKLKIN